jgi:hypothetical protein
MITKKCLEFYERLHPFEDYYHSRSLKDKRFVPEAKAEEDNEEPEEDPASQSSLSVDSDTEFEELPETIKLEAYRTYQEAQKMLAL